jgi:DNA-binding PadR family transcriptional regulator
MSEERDLTTLELVVLGLLSMEPQSGYSIINTFELIPYRRWSASPGSIYPMLKRLEQRGIIEGEVEMVYETRPRKMYKPTPKGLAELDEWINAPINNPDVLDQKDILLLKFLFAEKRLKREEVIEWLRKYEEAITTLESFTLAWQIDPNQSYWSPHQRLVMEATVLDINMQRTWIQVARNRLLTETPAEER